MFVFNYIRKTHRACFVYDNGVFEEWTLTPTSVGLHTSSTLKQDVYLIKSYTPPKVR